MRSAEFQSAENKKTGGHLR